MVALARGLRGLQEGRRRLRGGARFGTSETTGGGNEGTEEVAAKRPRVCGEEVIQRRLVGADGQSLLDITRMAFFQDVEASEVLMTEILGPRGCEMSGWTCPCRVALRSACRCARRFDTERQGFNEVQNCMVRRRRKVDR